MALQIISLGKSKAPVYNEMANSPLFESTVRYVTEALYKRIRFTPELLSIIRTWVTDHFLGSVDFFDANGRMLGPTKEKQIRRWWEENNVQSSAFQGMGTDLAVDGSGFGWHVSASSLLTTKHKEMMVKLKALSPQISRIATESENMPRAISYLAASTVTIKHDETGILYYVQEAAGKRIRWEKDQVTHIRLMDFNGEVRGMSPMKALIKEIVIMAMLKENIVAKLENGGSADNIISMKGTNGVSKARFERLRTALESFSHIRKSHGNMPIDAEIQIHPLGTALKDMEYRELAMFILSEFALSLSMPTSRVPFLMTGSGGSSNKGELSGNSEDAYQSLVNATRTTFENDWNKVFRQAGFTYKFRRDNLQDDVRETQASTQRAAYVSSVQDSLMRAGKQLTINAHLQLLSGKKMDISQDDIEDADQSQSMGFNSPLAAQGGPMQASNMDMRAQVSQDRSQAKQKTAFNNGVST